MNISFKKAWTTVFSNIKVTLFSRYDDNSYLNGLSKAVRTVNPNESDSADKLYKAIKAALGSNGTANRLKTYPLFLMAATAHALPHLA